MSLNLSARQTLQRSAWEPSANERAEAIDPGPDINVTQAHRLTSGNTRGFGRWDLVPLPDLQDNRLEFALRGTDYHLVYVEMRTSRGRRVFKFNPDDRDTGFRFGYRYEIGLGSDTRDGQWHEYRFDLNALVQSAEPGVTLERCTGLWVRVPGVVDVATLDAQIPPAGPGPLTEADVVRFLNQATFGATPDAIGDLTASRDLSGWIEDQWAQPQSETMPFILSLARQGNRQNRHELWWQHAVEGPDQLRQRVQFALSEIFVTSDLDYVLGNAQAAMCHWYDMLGRMADGNFRDLMTEVALHPVMGIYLSHLRNQRPDPANNIRPDENFARELMQLFTIGLYELEPDGRVRTSGGAPIPTFTSSIIENFARVFTGWNFNGVESMTSNNIPQDRYWLPMTPVEAFHDTDPKTLLNGQRLPGGRTARQDLDAALDNVFNHPNVGPFIAHRLIQRLVTSNPSGDYISRVGNAFDSGVFDSGVFDGGVFNSGVYNDGASNNIGSGVRGDMRAVIAAILLDPEARSRDSLSNSSFGKVKEPLIRLLQFWRAFNVQTAPESEGRYVIYSDHLVAVDDTLGQAPLMANSVFNFFSPDYSPAGTNLDAPEMQILTEAILAATNDMFHGMVFSDNTSSGRARPRQSLVDFTTEIELAGDLDALVNHLDTLLFGGTMPTALGNAIRTNLSSIPTDAEGRYLRAVEAIFVCVAAPAFMVQR